MCDDKQHKYIVGSVYEHNEIVVTNSSSGSKRTRYYKICTFICEKCGDIKETKLGMEDFSWKE